jgi:hypothetical protein
MRKASRKVRPRLLTLASATVASGTPHTYYRSGPDNPATTE